jgi:hypothetical protein
MQERYRKALAEQRGQGVPEVTQQSPEPGFYKAQKELWDLPPLPQDHIPVEEYRLRDFPPESTNAESVRSSRASDNYSLGSHSADHISEQEYGFKDFPIGHVFGESANAESVRSRANDNYFRDSDSPVPSDVSATPPLSPQVPESQLNIKLPAWWPERVKGSGIETGLSPQPASAWVPRLSGITEHSEIERIEEDEISLNVDHILSDRLANYIGAEEFARITDRDSGTFLDLGDDASSYIDPFDDASVLDVGGSHSAVIDSDSSYLWTESSVTGSSVLDVGGSDSAVIGSDSSYLWTESSVTGSSVLDVGGSDSSVVDSASLYQGSEISDDGTFVTADETLSTANETFLTADPRENDWGDKTIADIFARGNSAAAEHDREVESPEGRRAVIQRHLEELQQERAGRSRGNEQEL